MFFRIAAFEVRYLLKNPLLWLTAAATFILPFAALAFGFQLEEDVRVFKNSAYEVISKYRIISCLFMFATTVFVSNIVLRDDESAFAPILRSTGIGKFEYLYGRFAGAMTVVALTLALVSPAIWLGSLMPTAEAEFIGPNRLIDHGYAYFLIALPNVVITASIFFALATITRSMMTTYVGLVIFLGSYFTLMSAFGGNVDLVHAMALLDPFSGRAFDDVVRYWPPAERNLLLPDFSGNLLLNRLLWLAISAAFLVAAYAGFDFTRTSRPAASYWRRRTSRDLSDSDLVRTAMPVGLGRLPDPTYGATATRALFLRRLRFEILQVAKSPAFIVLMLYTAFLTTFALFADEFQDGSPIYPLTVRKLPTLQDVFLLIPLVVIIVYSGELVWRERDRRMHEIVDAAPHPNWAYVVPKTLAIGVVLCSLFLAAVGVSIATQVLADFHRLDLRAYLLHFVLPMTWDAMLVVALAMIVQVLSPHKYIGWGIMALWGFANFASVMPAHKLLNYAGVPPTPLSDMDGITSFWEDAWLFRLYWAGLAVLLLVAAHLMWRRGTETRFAPRLRAAARRLSGRTAVLAGGAAASFVATGAFAYYNTNVLNRYEPNEAADRYSAGYEKAYRSFTSLPQPSITHIKVAIDLYPEARRAQARGTYLIRNLTDQPVGTVHVRNQDRSLTIKSIALTGARLATHDSRFNHRIFKFERPMMPGETRNLTFVTERWQRGLVNGKPDVKVTENGTFLASSDLLPAVGVNRQPLVMDASIREEFGLPPAGRAKLEQLDATGEPADGMSWTTADITLSTRADQTPVAPGKMISEQVTGPRRTARFVSNSPIRSAFAVQSARYAVKRARAGGVDYAVYYHPDHPWNVERMLRSMQFALGYYQANFGPYQFDQARIVEFPSYGRNYAQAFANTIAYSELRGFQFDLRQPGTYDEITPMTAHELAHQYWGHQLSPAAMEGSLVLVETLAQYSAVAVIRRSLGEEQLRRLLRVQLNRYLAYRAWSKETEVPLLRAETQNFLLYNKGALVMHLLSRRLGEAAVNRALRGLLSRYRFRSAPYARSADLVTALRAEARTAEHQQLITDLFERITFYDLKSDAPTARQRADGKWVVQVPIEAGKAYLDSKGGETKAPLAETIEVGLLAVQPGGGSLKPADVLALKTVPVRSGRSVVTFIVDRKPAFAGIDPYGYYIDRNSSDNVAAVEGKG